MFSFLFFFSKQNMPIYSDGQENTHNWAYLLNIFSYLKTD